MLLRALDERLRERWGIAKPGRAVLLLSHAACRRMSVPVLSARGERLGLARIDGFRRDLCRDPRRW